MLISRFLTLAIDGSFSVFVLETTLSSTGESILTSTSFSTSGVFSAVKSNPGMGKPTLPLFGASLSSRRFSAELSDLIAPEGEKVVSFSIALLISRSTLTSTTYLRLSITFSKASPIRFLKLFSSINFCARYPLDCPKTTLIISPNKTYLNRLFIRFFITTPFFI